ncbi:hypothetical protein FO519_001639 [Halicephalobus sp. NKZ332]|nr:hypothetical protein FO519_001639 [Halicephalobus sp. NKZ332]
MLRRYSTIGLQNHVLNGPTILIGSSNLCDIVVKGSGVAERHALIEYHPVIRSYWLRDLGTLEGTFCNDKVLYGMVELKPADASTRIGHSQCTENGFGEKEQMTLPVIGSKVIPKPGIERFSRPSITSAKLCQHPVTTNGTDSDSPGTPISISTAPVVMNESTTKKNSNTRIISANAAKRSSSVGRENTGTKIPRKLPSLKTINGNNESSYLPHINGEKKRTKENGNQLLQRIIRLQQELHRKDEEIIKLKENATLPSTTGDRVQKHLNEYRVALAEAVAENAKLRAVLARDPGQISDKSVEGISERMQKAETNQKLSDLVYKTFFTVAVDELEGLNKMCVKFEDIKRYDKHITESTARDYSDVIGEIIKVVQDPFSFRLMEISTKCNYCFEKENLTKQQKKQVAEMFDRFLKQIIYPLSKALDAFLPVIKDTSLMARESAKACNIVSQWSRELGDQVRREGIIPNIMVYKVEDLETRFKENGLSKHWLPPSIIPLLKAFIVDKGKRKEYQKVSVLTETSRSDPDSRLPSLDLVSFAKDEFEKKESEFKKMKTKNKELQQIIEQLRTEKEGLIEKLDSMENSKYSLENSGIRARRTVGNGNLVAVEPVKRPHTPTPSIEVNEAEDEEGELEIGRGSPEELNDLIQVHDQTANPPSEVDSESTEKNSQLDELEEFQKLESAIEKEIEADDEISTKSTPKNSQVGTPLYDDSVADIDENEDWITGAADQEFLKRASLKDEDEDEEQSLFGDEDLEEYERAKIEAEQTLRHQETEEFTAESLEDSLDEVNKNESAEEHEISTPETPRLSQEDLQRKEKEKEKIEFWHLAAALANMLGVEIPEDDNPEIQADAEDEREQKRRRLVLDGIVKAMGDLLKKNREE